MYINKEQRLGRPAYAPCRPGCALLARYGWATKDTSRFPDQVTQVGNWLATSQNDIWQTKDDT